MPDFKKGISREQYLMFPEIIDDYISEENPVRFIDSFAETLDLLELGFRNALPKDKGTSSYNPKDLLKLYIYGYLNKIRSSRKLENETHRNVELMWLLRKLRPDFKTIADFRKDNLKALQNVCREFILVCKNLNLISTELVVIDGSKFKACNNRDKNYTDKSLTESIKKIDKRVNEYLKELDEGDKNEKGHKKLTSEELKEKIEKLKSYKSKYTEIKSKLSESGENQISITDSDSRLMKDKNSFIVGYNVQTVVESNSHLIVAYDVVQDGNDHNQLSKMSKQANEILESNKLKVLADTGYYTEQEIIATDKQGITPYVFKPIATPNTKKGLFTYEDFSYDNGKDIYFCPDNQELKFRGFGKSKQRLLRYYHTNLCSKCPLKTQCTEDKSGRRIGRSVNADVMERVNQRMEKQPEIGALRKQIVEHPFGTIKRGFDQGYFLLKGLQKVKTEISLSVLAYNIKRVINIIGIKGLMQYMAT